MTIRQASAADLGVLRELLLEFEVEVPEPPHRRGSLDRELEEIPEYLESGLALLAESDGGPVGYALARLEPPRICYLSDVYVRPGMRRGGLAKALLAGVVAWARERGAEYMTLEVLSTNLDARAVYRRLGFGEESLNLVCPLGELEPRLEPGARGDSFGSIHVQTDDADAVARAVAAFVPRLPGGSRGSAVAAPRNGWTAVYDELCDREPAMLRRLALELSDRMGAVVLVLGVEEGEVVRFILFERGSVVDEYLSVPEYHGPLPPGDVIALGANPTVLARLTGADPARVRETARTAATPAELPPAGELIASLAELLGVGGAAHGYAGARELPGVLLLDRA